MSPLLRRHHALALVCALGLIAAPAAAQRTRSSAPLDGDGREHGGPTSPIQTYPLKPNEIHVLNLHAREHTVLVLPYVVRGVFGGDKDNFDASLDQNKVYLRAKTLKRTETTITLTLDDDDRTEVAFRVTTDSLRPASTIVRFYDPVTQELNKAESEIAARYAAETDERVATLAEARVHQRLLMAGDVVRLNRTASNGPRGQRVRLIVESAQEMPGEDNAKRVYLRYRIVNETYAPLTDLYFRLTVTRETPRLRLFTKKETREVYDAQDVRTIQTIPPGGTVSGLLILEESPLRDRHEVLNIEAVGFGGRRRAQITRLLAGNGSGNID